MWAVDTNWNANALNAQFLYLISFLLSFYVFFPPRRRRRRRWLKRGAHLKFVEKKKLRVRELKSIKKLQYSNLVACTPHKTHMPDAQPDLFLFWSFAMQLLYKVKSQHYILPNTSIFSSEMLSYKAI